MTRLEHRPLCGGAGAAFLASEWEGRPSPATCVAAMDLGGFALPYSGPWAASRKSPSRAVGGPALLQRRSPEPGLEVWGAGSREAGLQLRLALVFSIPPPALVVSSYWKTASECILGSPESAQGSCTCFGNAGLGGTDVRAVLAY